MSVSSLKLLSSASGRVKMASQLQGQVCMKVCMSRWAEAFPSLPPCNGADRSEHRSVMQSCAQPMDRTPGHAESGSVWPWLSRLCSFMTIDFTRDDSSLLHGLVIVNLNSGPQVTGLNCTNLLKSPSKPLQCIDELKASIRGTCDAVDWQMLRNVRTEIDYAFYKSKVTNI
jgi:hypothetical protein